MKLTVPVEHLVRAIRACRLAASDDFTRPHLATVWIRGIADGMAHVYGTDGHWLAVAQLPEVTVSEPGIVGLARDDFARILKAAPRIYKKKPVDPIPATVEAVGGKLSFDFGARVTVTPRDLDPPPIAQVFPKGKSPKRHARPSISAHLLKLACTAAEEMSDHHRGVAAMRLVATGEAWDAPQMLWSPMAPSFFAIVMPMREERKRNTSWFTAQLAEMAKAAAKPEEEKAHAAE